ncbi:MAG: hypothetical protein IC227_01160 [Enterococcus lacertideformus]|uniref:Tyrosine-protein phosphatase n=1 Tax=Enterococcus lacertideformus TaxID=2771493 RepID=A0A931ASZ6_9ENTE|nr:hypothetical protein [Enterococcus lacertideformus]
MKRDKLPFIVDMHSHVLYGLDDGPKTIEESFQLIEQAQKQGIGFIVATPHLNHYQFDNNLEKMQQTYKLLQQKIKEKQLEITLILSHEIFLTIDFYHKYKVNDLFPIQIENDGNKLLVELPSYEIPYYFEEFILQTNQKGLSCIWAHPELNAEIQKNWKIVYDYLEFEDVEIQLTAGSLLGNYGRKVKKISWKMLKAGLVDYIASDAHDVTKRPFELKEAYELIDKKMGKDVVYQLQTKSAEIATVFLERGSK